MLIICCLVTSPLVGEVDAKGGGWGVLLAALRKNQIAFSKHD